MTVYDLIILKETIQICIKVKPDIDYCVLHVTIVTEIISAVWALIPSLLNSEGSLCEPWHAVIDR